MKIHLLGICGTGMSALAGLLKEKGHAISGSDNNFYPPVSEIIEKLNIKLLKGYKPENIPQDIDLVVIGNVISRGNPELEYILNKSIPFTSMPEALYNFFIRKNISIVIAGTHGKTTTTGLIAWGLEVIGKDPSFACGGVIKNFGKNYKLGKRGYFVIEGDEYETSFFDKGPKFLHYFPRYLILNAIEYDHADIFPSRKDYLSAFEKLINLIPEKGLIIYNGESPLTRKIIKKAWCETQSFGFSSKYTWWVKNIFYKDGLTHFTVLRKDKIFGEFKIPLIGDFNILNALASIALLYNLGYYYWQIQKALSNFEGIRKRLEKITENKGIILYDDFAHHPTAIKKVLSSLRNTYQNRRIWAIFEPRSWSVRKNIFQNILPLSFENADKVIISEVYKKEKVPPSQRLNEKKLVEDINKRNSSAFFIPKTAEILDFLKENLKENDVVVVMSNGYFDNLTCRLKEIIESL